MADDLVPASGCAWGSALAGERGVVERRRPRRMHRLHLSHLAVPAVIALAMTAAVSCGRPAPSPSESPAPDPTPPPTRVVAVVPAGPISCGPNFGGCWVRIVVYPGPEQTANAFVAAELPTDPLVFNQVTARSLPVRIAVANAGRHAVEVQIAYGSDIGPPPPPDAPKPWTPLCSGVVDLVGGMPWAFGIQFKGDDGCTIGAPPG